MSVYKQLYSKKFCNSNEVIAHYLKRYQPTKTNYRMEQSV